MSQVSLYTNTPEPDLTGTIPPGDYLWGWRFNDEDTGLVFASRDEAFQDVQTKHPEEAIG